MLYEDVQAFAGATVRADDSVVLGGFTSGNWATNNTGGDDFCAVKLDAEGEIVWTWQAWNSTVQSEGSRTCALAAPVDLTGSAYQHGSEVGKEKQMLHHHHHHRRHHRI